MGFIGRAVACYGSPSPPTVGEGLGIGGAARSDPLPLPPLPFQGEGGTPAAVPLLPSVGEGDGGDDRTIRSLTLAARLARGQGDGGAAR